MMKWKVVDLKKYSTEIINPSIIAYRAKYLLLTIVIYAKARLTESINTSKIDIAQFSHATTQYVTPSKAYI